MAIRISIFVLGLILNLIILVCYFRTKSDIARYIRIFAVFDIAVLTTSIVAFAWLNTFPENMEVFQYLKNCLNFLIAHSMLCPLFLALDRVLIVSFPHNFWLHERKMRVFKICLLVCTSLVSALFLVSGGVLKVLAMVNILNFFLQFLACLVIYAIIVGKIIASDRKMKNSRHVGTG